ncbi:MAG: tetratricopeptide repeat protein [Chitinophagaceae bacterium]|nr:tetratricopeptide repeat protein [Chitinophagaceae bacterium]MBP6478649.1 tetratricopeptide repeat protein [Chitinophagaceae bacterium]MBP7109827.1 tetratricopeptide repeat protein [Chitinophagaceae bacterium]MBP7315109.1 tetratricopeptide repeat protein [Chitinophagaceae bacterium]HQV56332.1 tetratricopeptide repeat protein [Chitinophagaceae bacterium]
MKRFAKIISRAVILMILISSCNDKGSDSPFSDILEKEPYASLTDSIRQEPDNDGIYFRRAVLLNSNNLPEPALEDFKKAWSLKKDERYAYGFSNLLLDKKPDSAIQFLNDAIKELPNSFLLQLTLARSYDANGKTENALELVNKILQANPEQVDVMKMKAGLLGKKGNNAEAISILEKAYSLTPYDIELNYELAFKYAESKNPRVIKLCDSLIKVDTLNLHAEPYYYKGIYFSNMNDKAKALSLFDEALQHDYYYLNAYIEKATVLYDQRKFGDALKTVQLANTISATFPDAYFWMGKCNEAMGNLTEAKLNYQRAFSLDNTFTEAKEAADKLGK